MISNTKPKPNIKESIEKFSKYPYYSLEESIKFSETVYDLGGNDVVAKETIMAHLKIESKANNRLVYSLSSAECFGLIDRSKKGYSITPLGKNILTKTDENEYQQDIRDAFLKAELYQKLYDRYYGNKIPPKDVLKHVLLRYNFKKTKAEKAAESFIKSVNFSGIMNIPKQEEDLSLPVKIFNEKTLLVSNSSNKLLREIEPQQNEENLKGGNIDSLKDKVKIDHSLNEKYEKSIELKYPTSSGENCEIKIPIDITPDELEKLIDIIKVLKGK